MPAPLTLAEKQRRYRERRRRNEIVVHITLDEADRDFLIEQGVLAAWDEDDRAALVRAVEQLLRRQQKSKAAGAVNHQISEN